MQLHSHVQVAGGLCELAELHALAYSPTKHTLHGIEMAPVVGGRERTRDEPQLGGHRRPPRALQRAARALLDGAQPRGIRQADRVGRAVAFARTEPDHATRARDAH